MHFDPGISKFLQSTGPIASGQIFLNRKSDLLLNIVFKSKSESVGIWVKISSTFLMQFAFSEC